MNDLTQNSQGHSVPTSDYKKIWDLIIGGSLSILPAVVSANLTICSVAFDEWEESEQPKQKVKSLVDMSISHLLDAKTLIEMACEVRNFIEFQHSLRLIDDLINALNAYLIVDKDQNPNEKITSCLLFGLQLSAEKLVERIGELGDVVYANREVLNG